MNEDQDWNQLENEWKEGAASSDIAQVVKQVKADDRSAAWRLRLGAAAACVAIAVSTSWCVLHRSVEVYTFTVIGWSAIFSLGGYLLSSRESASDLAADTTTALKKRARSLSKAAQLLDFGRTLIGVEAVICVGFWIALHQQNLRWALQMTGIILSAGVFLYIAFSRLLVSTRGELQRLESIVAHHPQTHD
jgi:hypothetical protein